jgi:hypothetical protein
MAGLLIRRRDDQWLRETEALAVIGRILRIARYLERDVELELGRFGLSISEFNALSALRRRVRWRPVRQSAGKRNRDVRGRRPRLGYAGNRSTKERAEQVANWMAGKGWEALTVPLAPSELDVAPTTSAIRSGCASRRR